MVGYYLADLIFEVFPELKDKIVSEVHEGYIRAIAYDDQVYLSTVELFTLIRIDYPDFKSWDVFTEVKQ